MHIAMSFALDVSVSTQVAVLRHLLFVDDSKPSLLHLDKEADVWARVREVCTTHGHFLIQVRLTLS